MAYSHPVLDEQQRTGEGPHRLIRLTLGRTQHTAIREEVEDRVGGQSHRGIPTVHTDSYLVEAGDGVLTHEGEELPRTQGIGLLNQQEQAATRPLEVFVGDGHRVRPYWLSK